MLETYLSKPEDFIGKFLTVTFMDYTEDGSVRHPVGKGIREE